MTNEEIKKAVMDVAILSDMDDFDQECRVEIDTFKEWVDDECVIDSDGYGRLVIDGKIVENSRTNLDEKLIQIKNGPDVPIKSIAAIFGNDAAVVWYNR